MAIFVLLDGVGEGFFVLGEVENPGVGGVEVVGLNEVERFELIGREGVSGLDAEEEGTVLVGERGEGVEGVAKRGLWVGVAESGAVGTIKVITERGGMLDGESLEIFTFEPESLVTFEIGIGLPGFGL